MAHRRQSSASAAFRRGSLGLFVGLSALTGSVLAQPVSAPDALKAADPLIPSALPSTAPPLPAPVPDGPAPAADREQALAVWRQANARVAEFPRGHMDLLRWEAKNTDTVSTEDRQTPVLDAAEVLRRSMVLRPDLVAGPDTTPAAAMLQRSRWAEHVRLVQAAWLEAVAAIEHEQIARDVMDNARTGAELGRRMVQAGNWSQARHLQEQLIETRSRQAWLVARMARQSRIEQLARLTGDWEDAAIADMARRLPRQLPAIPPSPPTAADAHTSALSRQPGLDSQRVMLTLALGNARLSDWDQAVNEATALASDRAAGWPSTPQLNNRQLSNNHRLQEAVEQRAAVLTTATARRSQVREATHALQTLHALARLAQDELLARQKVAEQETSLRYNGMLMSTWDLLGAARERLGALNEAQGARLRYWLAEADWRSLLNGGSYAGAPGAADNGNTTNSNAGSGGH